MTQRVKKKIKSYRERILEREKVRELMLLLEELEAIHFGLNLA